MKSGQVRMNPRAATIDDMRAILAAMRTPTGDAAPVVEREGFRSRRASAGS
jgi:hypothetical protein